ncbi:MAG: NYN domain-containing protein [Gemmatimonadota bacterium]
MNEHYTHAPHRRPGAEEQYSNAALLIDFDNVTMGTRSNLGQELRKLLNSDIIKGKVAVQRAYADWRRYPQYIVSLSESSIDLIFAPAYGSSKKNATDIRLAIDALELVFTRPEIGTYILLSGDSDFSSLVLKLKEYGKYVIGVGMQESSSDLLVQNCDEYYSYNSISGLTSAADGPTEKHDPWVLAGRTILKMKERKDVMRSDRFKQVMLELDPSFDEKEIGFSKFNRFLSEAASRGILSLEKAANGQYEVAAGSRAKALASGDGAADTDLGSSEPDRAPEKRSRSRSRGSRRGSDRKSKSTTPAPPSEEEAPDVDADRLRSAYALLAEVTAALASPGDPVRDSEVKRRMLEREGKFDEAALGFSKFSRFLRQAHDEGIVDLERGPEGNYLVSPNEDGPVAIAPSAGTKSTRETTPKPSSSDRSSSRGRRGRSESRSSDRGRSARGKSSRDRSDKEESGPQPQAEPESEVRDSTPASEPAGGAGAGAEPRGETPEKEPAARSEGPEDSSSKPEPRRSVGVGRFRRGSRSKGSGPAGSSGPSPEKKVVPGPVEGQEPAPSQTDEKPRTKSSDRGQTRAPSTSSADAGGVAARYRSEIETMSRNYPGVGRRTAEVLFREFGAEVFEVIDSRPDRIRAVLPEHRAKAVLAGRKAELGD